MKKKRTSRHPLPPKPQGSEEREGLNPRQALFEEFYRQGGPDFRPGNAYQSALAAGYSPITAKANCHILARKIRVDVKEALEMLGCDALSQAKKLLALREAQLVKWNPAKYPGVRAQRKTKKTAASPGKPARGGWDVFEDNTTQLETTKEINRIFGAYPAPKEPGDNRPVQIIFPPDFKSVTVRAPETKG